MRKALDGDVLRDVTISVMVGAGGAVALLAFIYSLNH